MTMKEAHEAVPHSYAFCDIYSFKGDQVAELTVFVIKTDGTNADQETRKQVAAQSSER